MPFTIGSDGNFRSMDAPRTMPTSRFTESQQDFLESQIEDQMRTNQGTEAVKASFRQFLPNRGFGIHRSMLGDSSPWDHKPDRRAGFWTEFEEEMTQAKFHSPEEEEKVKEKWVRKLRRHSVAGSINDQRARQMVDKKIAEYESTGRIPIV